MSILILNKYEKKTIKQVCGKINEFIPMVAFRQFLLQTFKKKTISCCFFLDVCDYAIGYIGEPFRGNKINIQEYKTIDIT